MKVGILYICTGIYVNFWKDFYCSAEEFFLPEIEKNYYVFTDAENIYAEKNKFVHKIYQENLGWPGNTLYRFRVFSSHMNLFQNNDYLYFLNANMLFKKIVGTEVMPKDRLLVVQHPGWWRQSSDQFQYDRNPKSKAYIPFGEGDVYVMGGFNGGPVDIYKKMIKDLEKATDVDTTNGVIARWHDESHLNKYILTHSYQILSPSYGYPEGWYRFPFECKILIRDKVISGGRIFIQRKGWSLWDQLKYYIMYYLNFIRKH